MHHFELTSFANETAGVAKVDVEAIEHAETLVFLRSVKDGPANQSYGLQVAALAGIPRSVTNEARCYLADCLRSSVSSQSQLPLFSAPALGDLTPQVPAALRALRATEPDELSPPDALSFLFHPKQLDQDETHWEPN